MPELPEVETVKSVLKPIVINKTIIKIDVLRATTILGNVEEFKKNLVGETFENITRIGKFLIFHLSHQKVFLSHLRMEGKFFEVKETEPNTPYARVVFHLNNGMKICYDDSRCFGIMKLTSEDRWQEEKEIKQLGPEPFYIDDVTYFLKRCAKTNLPIKSVLLDQTLMTGLGNIYADEVLFASQIHPLTPAKYITKEEWDKILKNAQRILKEAIIAGGSTIRSYHPGKNIDGTFQSSLLAYGHKDDDCSRCHHPMRFMKVNGRGTTYCPICQIKHGPTISVAIFGLTGSGKSTILEEFNKAGYMTISSDEIVKELYEKEEVIATIEKMFNLCFTDKVDKDKLRNYLFNHPQDKRKLERYVHPLVKDLVAKFIKDNPLSAVEVPLLYEAKMDDMFDVLIAVDADDEVRLKRMQNRDINRALALEKINNFNNPFYKNKRKADFIILNNDGSSDLIKKTQAIINILKARQS
ncbi:MAG: bifunctional DNA-formamidopyrimidine glycosylase/DNA-(apurinic or apyrimidinic site) lyase [Bacilli bacterium]